MVAREDDFSTLTGRYLAVGLALDNFLATYLGKPLACVAHRAYNARLHMGSLTPIRQKG